MTPLPGDPPTLHEMDYPSRRSAVLGLRGMVATSQPIAVDAGIATLRRGGGAVDAALAAAAALTVVEPTGCGLGGDCFALVYRARDRAVLAYAGAGRSPAALDVSLLGSRGLHAMPVRGPLSITVPGAVDAWCALSERFGRLPLSTCLAPATEIADRGFPVSELIARAWRRSERLLSDHPAAREHFLPGGAAPYAGQIVRMQALSKSLRAIADDGRDAFYRGSIARTIARTVADAGGVLSTTDLAEHAGAWVDPISIDHAGARIWQCPPPCQGIAALLAIGIRARALAGAGTSKGAAAPRAAWLADATDLHVSIEAMRLAFAAASRNVADPDHIQDPAPLDALLDDAVLKGHARSIDPARTSDGPPPAIPPQGGTVYLAAVDADGNACSLIASNYMGFGSGLVAGSTGIPLQNRGAGFTLEPGHPNRLAPRKRPFHTIMPGLATRREDGELLSVFGVMGGHMQPQGHLQVLTSMLERGLDPQRALDAPRFQIQPDARVALEPPFGDDVRAALAHAGHELVPRNETPDAGTFGGGQMIVVTRDGVRIGGSDPRKDGLVAAEF